jgi:S-adenosylmethionine/arginine decarboxylase-like enzyme
MKAIVIISNGIKQFYVYKQEHIYNQFKKVCVNSGLMFIESKAAFEYIIENFIPIENGITYKGRGIYDKDLKKCNRVLTDEVGTKYSIEYYDETTDAVKMIPDLKGILIESCLN